ncbi:MAG: hypothetical protein HC863_02385 [Myxococcales bacterium]|nr:hypothetical protein [Myxococcales bacterium]
MLVMTAGKKLCEFILEPPAGTPTTDPDPTPPASAPVDQSKFASLDRQARQFLADTKHIQDHEIVRDSAFGRTFRIYHLPSGVPAFPLPRHVNEKDDVEIWIVVPFDGKANVEVTSCDKVPAYRVSGSYSAGKEALGRLESGERVQFGLEGYARRLSCAGTLSYKIDLAFQGVTASTATSLPFDPVVRFEWGIGYLFDFTRPRRLSLGDRVADDGSGEKFVSESKDYAGARPVLTLSVNVCGTNPAELSWCDRLLNPTVVIDPKDPTGTFGLGLMVRPFHGFAVLAGMTVGKSAELADGVEAKVGDTWSVAGELPTKNVFNDDGIGFVLGAVVSTDVLADLFKKPE